MSEPRGGRGGWRSRPGSGSFSLASPNCFPDPKQVATEQGWGVGGALTAPTPLLSALISRNIPTSVMGRQPAPRRRQSPRKCKHILAAPRPSSHKVLGSLGPPPPPRSRRVRETHFPPHIRSQLLPQRGRSESHTSLLTHTLSLSLSGIHRTASKTWMHSKPCPRTAVHMHTDRRGGGANALTVLCPCRDLSLPQLAHSSAQYVCTEWPFSTPHLGTSSVMSLFLPPASTAVHSPTRRGYELCMGRIFLPFTVPQHLAQSLPYSRSSLGLLSQGTNTCNLETSPVDSQTGKGDVHSQCSVPLSLVFVTRC